MFFAHFIALLGQALKNSATRPEKEVDPAELIFPPM
jgi:hypothetical protein